MLLRELRNKGILRVRKVVMWLRELGDKGILRVRKVVMLLRELGDKGTLRVRKVRRLGVSHSRSRRIEAELLLFSSSGIEPRFLICPPYSPLIELIELHCELAPYSTIGSIQHSTSWEASRFSASQEIPPFFGTWRFITAFTSARQLYLSWASSILSIPPSHPTSAGLRLLVIALLQWNVD